jgi:cytochrome d ubiquinol oxidase subunit II
MFRSYGSHTHEARHRWGFAFAVASLVTPILLGAIIGAISSGAVATASRTTEVQPSFASVYVAPWAAPFALAVGGFALVIFAYLAAVYAAAAANDVALRDDFRSRALGSAVAVFVFAALSLVLARAGAPRVSDRLLATPWAIVLHLCTAAAAITAILALWRRQYARARVAAGAQVSFILWGWALAEYPYLIPESMTIRDTAAPDTTLRLLLVGLAIGAAVLLPSLRYMLKTFTMRS